MITWTTLDQVLLPLTDRSPLQQGWSPRCEPHPAEPGEWGVLKTTAIQRGRFAEDANKRLPDRLVPKPALEVEVGDLLMTCAGPRARCGVPTLIRHTRAKLMISGKMYRFRVDPQIVDARFLELFLLSGEAQARINEMKTGISDSGLNLTKGRFLGLSVPVIPLNAQKRTVEIVEAHLSRLDAAEVLVGNARKRVQRMVASAQDRLIWGVERETVAVSELLRERMRNGHSARAVKDGEAGIRTLTLTAVTLGRFRDEYTKITVADPDKVVDLWLEPGDILVQRANTPALVGTTALFDGPAGWAIFPDLLIRLRVDEARVRPNYLALALSAERTHRSLRTRAKGLAGSMPKVDQTAIGATRVPLPTLDHQDAILNEMNSVRDRASLLERELSRTARRATRLRNSLLTAAFSGWLTGSSSDIDRVEELAEAGV